MFHPRPDLVRRLLIVSDHLAASDALAAHLGRHGFVVVGEVRSARSAALAARTARHWLDGVPMHWMSDWGTPHPLFVDHASGATLVDVDGHAYADFCLGDSGAILAEGTRVAVDPTGRFVFVVTERSFTVVDVR